MNQYIKYPLQFLLVRVFFIILTLVMIPVFVAIIDSWAVGPVIFSLTICALYLGILYDRAWKVARHDRQSYATERKYALKGVVLGFISEAPCIVCVLLLLINPANDGLRSVYRAVLAAPYMGFLNQPPEPMSVMYPLTVLIAPLFTGLGYYAGLHLNLQKESLPHKLMYKKR